ncbi:hypothetical protein AMECASPLE_010072 [Ameca splendens]|uniref:Uncharacterized protein n=1 Tax=Ameca splendens TaxID=208324 RepID=A0ABV0Z051_9TELE
MQVKRNRAPWLRCPTTPMNMTQILILSLLTEMEGTVLTYQKVGEVCSIKCLHQHIPSYPQWTQKPPLSDEMYRAKPSAHPKTVPYL